jgi:hypothetical protein
MPETTPDEIATALTTSQRAVMAGRSSAGLRDAAELIALRLIESDGQFTPLGREVAAICRESGNA